MSNFTRMHNNYLDPDKNIPDWCENFDETTLPEYQETITKALNEYFDKTNHQYTDNPEEWLKSIIEDCL